MNDYTFSKSEKRIRIQWFIVAGFFLIVPLVSLIYTTILFINTPSLSAAQEKALIQQLVEMSIKYIFSTFFIFLLYWHAYKKSGTKFLTFSLIMIPIGFLRSLTPSQTESDSIALILNWIDFVILVYWYFLIYKMRKINQKVNQARCKIPTLS